jgi:hypothetical protein
MMLDYSMIREKLESAKDDAQRVYELDKQNESGAFASGRYDGLKQAIQILDSLWQES